eukprot:TRINITY_DN17151_c1_g1_i1.p1 TRINITY_DN17151_c1_g1~~TRINITY_DN17151_c1_g1_i1.p1  ORF type:complete len:690 (+),score=59.02 TRINITY_DN17151_c1_g1_i1:70-2070(+)
MGEIVPYMPPGQEVQVYGAPVAFDEDDSLVTEQSTRKVEPGRRRACCDKATRQRFSQAFVVVCIFLLGGVAIVMLVPGFNRLWSPKARDGDVLAAAIERARARNEAARKSSTTTVRAATGVDEGLVVTTTPPTGANVHDGSPNTLRPFPVQESHASSDAKPSGKISLKRPTCLMDRIGMSELPAEMCFYAGWEDCEYRQYPMTASLVDSAIAPGDVMRLVPLIDKLKQGKTVYVVEIGGSFTFGEGCDDRTRQVTQCAWASRTERWLRSVFPRSNIVWEHRARRSTTSVGFLTGIGATVRSLPGPPDLIFVDTLINDVWEASRGFESKLKLPDVQRGGFEALLIALMELAPQAQIMVMLDACPECIPRADIHRDVARHYNVSVLDYAIMAKLHNKAGNKSPKAPDWLWPQAMPPMAGAYVKVWEKWPSFAPEYVINQAFCCATNHPPWYVHEKMSEVASYAILKGLELACSASSSDKAMKPYYPSKPLMPTTVLDAFPACVHPTSYYSAADAFGEKTKANASRPIFESGDWALTEDKVGKPGWIGKSPGGTILFPLKFDMKGAKGYHLITISWLTSYEGVENAWAFMYPKEHPEWKSEKVILKATITEHVSQVHSGFFGIGPMDTPQFFHWHDWHMVNYPEYMLQIVIPPLAEKHLKFKVVEVTSC